MKKAEWFRQVEQKKRQFRDYERTPDKKLSRREVERVREATHQHLEMTKPR